MERSTFNRLFGGAPSRLTAVDARRTLDTVLRTAAGRAATPPSLAKPNRIR